MKDSSSRNSVSNGSPHPQEEAPPSQLKVTAVVVFYLVAAIVVSPLLKLGQNDTERGTAPAELLTTLGSCTSYQKRERERVEGCAIELTHAFLLLACRCRWSW